MGFPSTVSVVFCILLWTAAYSDLARSELLLPHSDEPVIKLFRFEPYRTNYLLPARFTGKQDTAFFEQLNPNKALSKTEVEFQVSLTTAIAHNIFIKGDRIRCAYTQNSFWQAYDKSAYFRDTDYQPELFYVVPVHKEWHGWELSSASVGIWHESNGKGGKNERSWNRLFVGLLFKKEDLSVSVKPWVRFKVSHDYNKNISDYRGHGEVGILYKSGRHQWMFKGRNILESGFSRGYGELEWLFPVYENLKGFVKISSGYGSSVSTYDHYDNAIGIGMALSTCRL